MFSLECMVKKSYRVSRDAHHYFRECMILLQTPPIYLQVCIDLIQRAKAHHKVQVGVPMSFQQHAIWLIDF